MHTRRIVTKIPSQYILDEEPLFEYTPIKRTPKTYQEYSEALSFQLRSFQSKINNQRNPKNLFDVHLKNPKQVVVKNIGNLDGKHLINAMGYIIKNSSSQNVFDEFYEQRSFKEIMDDWKLDCTNQRENAKVALHLVFSLKEAKSKSVLEILKESVYQTLKTNLNEYSFALVIHSHQNQPHIHCIINKTNQLNGKKLHFKNKAECREFYSVAQHCLAMTKVFDDRTLQQWSLIHEVFEGFTGMDIPTPIKRSKDMKYFKEAEERAITQATKVFKLTKQSIPKEIKVADKRMMITEALQWMHTHNYDWTAIAEPFTEPEILDFVKKPMGMKEAESEFLKLWTELFPSL